MNLLSQHRRTVLAAVCIICTGLVAAMHWTGFELMLRMEFGARDFLTRHARKSPTHPDIVFLAIDQPTVSLDGAFAEEIEASPALQVMKRDG